MIGAGDNVRIRSNRTTTTNRRRPWIQDLASLGRTKACRWWRSHGSSLETVDPRPFLERNSNTVGVRYWPTIGCLAEMRRYGGGCDCSTIGEPPDGADASSAGAIGLLATTHSCRVVGKVPATASPSYTPLIRSYHCFSLADGSCVQRRASRANSGTLVLQLSRWPESRSVAVPPPVRRLPDESCRP